MEVSGLSDAFGLSKCFGLWEFWSVLILIWFVGVRIWVSWVLGRVFGHFLFLDLDIGF